LLAGEPEPLAGCGASLPVCDSLSGSRLSAGVGSVSGKMSELPLPEESFDVFKMLLPTKITKNIQSLKNEFKCYKKQS
jgi:hypothetical protein